MGRPKKQEKPIIDDNPKLLNTDQNILIQGLQFLQNPTKGNTIINLAQINGLTQLNMVGQVYGVYCFNDFVKVWTEYKVSEKGIGREQILKMSEAIQIYEKEKRLHDREDVMPGKP